MNKIELPASKLLQASPITPVVLVTCIDKEGRPNIITLGMFMLMSFNPPLVCIGVSPKRFSHDLILDSSEFVVNVPAFDIKEESHFCGVNSGRELDKFALTGLTVIPSKKVNAPSIKECFGHLECRVVQTHTCGDHTLFVGEVLSASLNEDVFVDDKMDPLKSKPLTQKNHVYYSICAE